MTHMTHMTHMYSFDELHALPEGDVSSDLACQRRRPGVVPRGICVAFAVYLEAVIAGHAFPEAETADVARTDVLAIDGLRREVVIALDYNRYVAFGDHRAVPHSFHWYTSHVLHSGCMRVLSCQLRCANAPGTPAKGRRRRSVSAAASCRACRIAASLRALRWKAQPSGPGQGKGWWARSACHRLAAARAPLPADRARCSPLRRGCRARRRHVSLAGNHHTTVWCTS